MQKRDELIRNNLLYENMFEISDDGFLIVDREGYILDINSAYSEYLGIPKDKIIGKYIFDIIKNSKLPLIMETEGMEVGVLHKLAEGQSPTKEKYVVVSRGAVIHEGHVIGAVAQIKFSKNTVSLAGRLKEKDSELEYYKNELKRFKENQYSFENMVGVDESFLQAKRTAMKAAKNELTVLITGETGTGKEVFANAIHYASRRSKGPFIRVNCAAIPNELMESELFGYEEGAFTGAKKGGKKGKFELAHKGTIFLDEIGDMPLKMQAKLLRVLQEREVEKVGGSKTIPIDVRVIAATNKNLMEEIDSNRFRMDLYYRLNVIQIAIKPLRERKMDILGFAEQFLNQMNDEYHRDVKMDERVRNVLMDYHWPGNVRELKNIMNNSFNMLEGNVITIDDLPFYIIKNKNLNQLVDVSKKLDVLVNEFEREIIVQELKNNQYNCVTTAKTLGIHRSTLYKKIDKHGIQLYEKRRL